MAEAKVKYISKGYFFQHELTPTDPLWHTSNSSFYEGQAQYKLNSLGDDQVSIIKKGLSVDKIILGQTSEGLEYTTYWDVLFPKSSS